MISFTVNGSCITKKTAAEICKMFDKLSFMNVFKDKKFQMIVYGKESGLRHIGLCYVKGSIEEKENGCKIEYRVFPGFICVYKLYLDVMRGFRGFLGFGAVLSEMLMLLPVIIIVLESHSQQNACKERLQYLLSEGKTIIML